MCILHDVKVINKPKRRLGAMPVVLCAVGILLLATLVCLMSISRLQYFDLSTGTIVHEGRLMGVTIWTSKQATLVSDEFSRLAIQPLVGNGRVTIGMRGSSLGGLFLSQFTDLCHFFAAYHVSDIERRDIIMTARDIAIADGQTGLEGYLFPMFSNPPDKSINRR